MKVKKKFTSHLWNEKLSTQNDSSRVDLVAYYDQWLFVYILGCWLFAIGSALFRRFLPLEANILILPITLPTFIYYAKKTIWVNDQGIMLNDWRHPRFVEWTSVSKMKWTDARIGKRLTIELKNGEDIGLTYLKGPDPTDEALVNAYEVTTALIQKAHKEKLP